MITARPIPAHNNPNAMAATSLNTNSRTETPGTQLVDGVQVAKTPTLPTFATFAEERLHRKQRLASAFRLFAKFGFSEGVAGHITARDPERVDHFWVNPFGMHFGLVRVSDLVLVDEHGVVVEGKHPVNEAAFAIHSRLHMARPDVIAAAHAHSLYGKTWSTLGRLLDPLTQDACAFYEDHSLYDDYTGVVYDMSEGDRIARALGHRKAVILQNHGILTVGSTVDEAAWFFITMDRSCQAQLMAEAAGKPRLISPESARVAQKQVGNARVGWFQYQPLWDLIVREQPDLLD
jgi:ribulose-5-phosphate 4-epimerase/fuculose-1-phosphate aldolase